ncbi:MAG TPA: DUF1257 domain-containing protein [Armatimonadota bacterium]|nr:DUF1257 domain-containing protein [Armatimonadota bacterium]
MSVVFVVVPVVAGGWPVLSAAILAASAALGYRAIEAAENRLQSGLYEEDSVRCGAVSLMMDDSQVITDTLARGESFTVDRSGIRAVFGRDGRGRCTVHLTGEGKSELELEAAGRELMDRVRQQFAYAKVMEELEARGFQVVEEQAETEGSIRVRVRRW